MIIKKSIASVKKSIVSKLMDGYKEMSRPWTNRWIERNIYICLWDGQKKNLSMGCTKLMNGQTKSLLFRHARPIDGKTEESCFCTKLMDA